MNTATNIGNISISSHIKALGMPAADTRKALHILALSETLIGLVFSQPEAKAEITPTLKVKPVLKTQ